MTRGLKRVYAIGAAALIFLAARGGGQSSPVNVTDPSRTCGHYDLFDEEAKWGYGMYE